MFLCCNTLYELFVGLNAENPRTSLSPSPSGPASALLTIKHASFMKSIALACGIWLAGIGGSLAQPAGRSVDLASYYEWFQDQAQVRELYARQSVLYVFNPQTPLFQGPDLLAPVVGRLSTGDMVTSRMPAHVDELPSQSLLGMEELWYPVEYKSASGETVRGYVWGGDIAKGWREEDLDRDGRNELILLGLSADSNLEEGYISGAIKTLKDKQVLSVTPVPQLCIFEACSVTPLLRRVPIRHPQDMIIVETSVLHIGCQQGLYRAFFYWNGIEMQRVYQSEWTKGKVMHRSPFKHRVHTPHEVTTYECTYSSEDGEHNPVWDCRELKSEKTVSGSAVRSRAR